MSKKTTIYYTLPEAIEYLGVTKRVLHHHIKQGRLVYAAEKMPDKLLTKDTLDEFKVSYLLRTSASYRKKEGVMSRADVVKFLNTNMTNLDFLLKQEDGLRYTKKYDSYFFTYSDRHQGCYLFDIEDVLEFQRKNNYYRPDHPLSMEDAKRILGCDDNYIAELIKTNRLVPSSEAPLTFLAKDIFCEQVRAVNEAKAKDHEKAVAYYKEKLTTSKDVDGFISRIQTADLLEISEANLAYYVKKGDLPYAEEAPERCMFRLKDVKDFAKTFLKVRNKNVRQKNGLMTRKEAVEFLGIPLSRLDYHLNEIGDLEYDKGNEKLYLFNKEDLERLQHENGYYGAEAILTLEQAMNVLGCTKEFLNLLLQNKRIKMYTSEPLTFKAKDILPQRNQTVVQWKKIKNEEFNELNRAYKEQAPITRKMFALWAGAIEAKKAIALGLLFKNGAETIPFDEAKAYIQEHCPKRLGKAKKTMVEKERLYSVKEVAELYGLTTDAIYKQVRLGQLVPERRTPSIVFTASVVKKHLPT